jgi:hypothetical protein
MMRVPSSCLHKLLAVIALLTIIPVGSLRAEDDLPWDFDPYRVMIWVAGVTQDEIDGDLGVGIKAYLDRDFNAIWRTNVVAAPNHLSVLARRDFNSIGYATLTANDMVMVMKRNHEHAARIRFPADVPDRIKRITVTKDYLATVRQQFTASESESLGKLLDLISEVEGTLLDLQTEWEKESTEAMVLPRGMAMKLEPKAKLVELDVPGKFSSLFDSYDKLFVVLVDAHEGSTTISAREIDCMMRWPGPMVHEHIFQANQLPAAIGRCVTRGFAPVVRLDEIGTKEIQGRIRAGGLILDETSPANIQVGDFLQPLLRKDDRDGEPTFVGIVDWTFLRTKTTDGSKVTLDIQSGRAGALAGRRNSRTFRMALKIRPVFEKTVLRLHAKGQPLAPLAGYDVYQKDLESGEMTLVGQSDWDGRLEIEKTDVPLRLLYVKNGAAILARLPIVPGQTEFEVADLVGDDIRLQAEAYIRGVQNSIVDLVAIRKLIAANIRGYIKQGDFNKADELFDKLRKEPSYDKLANDMELKKTQITSRNATEQMKIERLFGETRTLLIKHINPGFIRELETELNAAKGMPTGAAPKPESEDT